MDTNVGDAVLLLEDPPLTPWMWSIFSGGCFTNIAPVRRVQPPKNGRWPITRHELIETRLTDGLSDGIACVVKACQASS